MPLGNLPQQNTDRLFPRGYEQVTVLGAAQPLPNLPDAADVALVNVMGGNLRWRDDGTAPTDAIGMLIIENDTIQYYGDLSAFQFIADAVSPGTEVNISYYSYSL